MARNRQRARERKEQERLHREGVPGALDHASGQVDEVEARIVAGAGGQAANLDDDEDDGSVATATPPAARAEAKAPASGARGTRFLSFLAACWAELQRVQWPDRRQVGQATAVVLGFVVVAGAFLGLADIVAQQLIDLLL
ncbi:MAG: preprotein translocase subunit SecE [Solirubrobacterales bacterium]|nr:preprotein translocase subunit SecE [Solirubrobacterales bacterium]